ncbi:MAG: SH3 domain-containing protein [Saprospiraceae bacterium]|nr:SH3 domain-containing protein [Saprospiraceae bacterium]MDW8230048.1 SH3 domain-containing protein [Saprospiraceae bacterium]
MPVRYLFLLLGVGLWWACGPKKESRPEGEASASAGVQRLYVHAADGLVLRKTPAKDGEKIAVVPRDTVPVTVLAPAAPNQRYVAEKAGDFELSGGWVKVCTASGQEGYLFEGYLLPFPPLKDWPGGDMMDVEVAYSYVSKPTKREKLEEPELMEGYRQYYQDGAFCDTKIYHGGSTFIFSIPASSLTLQQALVLFRPLWFRESSEPLRQEPEREGVFVSGDGGYSFMSVALKGDRVVVEMGSAD